MAAHDALNRANTGSLMSEIAVQTFGSQAAANNFKNCREIDLSCPGTRMASVDAVTAHGCRHAAEFFMEPR